jgi:phosphate transport system protein
MNEHTTRAFDADLSALTRKIGEMGRLDEKQIKDAVEALEKRDAALARLVIQAEDQVDALQREVEEKAVATIARRQPVAVDLREIVGALRISNDLERIGDLAQNIAKRVLLLGDASPPNPVVLQLNRMAELVLGQLRQVLNSYERREVAAALEVWRKDQEVDALHTSIFRELLTYMMENPRNITFCTHALFCSKNVERMGDHTTNIAETIYYIVEGKPVLETRPKADMTSSGSLPS